jgi:hypothetical protein
MRPQRSRKSRRTAAHAAPERDRRRPEAPVTAPQARPRKAIGRSLIPPVSARQGIGPPSPRLWLVVCLLFVTSSMISVAGLILLIGWITRL